MISGFLVKKGRMTSVYTPEGKRIGVTKCVANPLVITQVKTVDKDGYNSVQVAYDSKKRLNKAILGKMSKSKLDLKPRFFKEFKLTTDQIPQVGSNISFESVFKDGDIVNITGISKGHGFAGVVKRHGFKKQPILGSSNYVRRPGSIGAQTPGKVVKGKKMPGHFGVETTTISGLEIFSINPQTFEILIKGSVPGSFNSWVVIKKSN